MGLGLQQNTLLPLRGFLCLFFLAFMNKRAEPFCTPTGGAVAIGHLHSFTFLELLPSLTLLSGGSTDALLSREVIGGVLLQSVWCVLLGVISTTCGFLLVIQTLCACYTGWGNVHGDAVGCPPYTPSFLRAGGERRGGDFV